MALAPITDYVTLVAAVIAWLERTDLADVIPVAIGLAEKRLTRTLRVRQLVRRSTAPVPVGSEYIDLPDDYMELIRVRPMTSPASNPLRYLTPSQMTELLGENQVNAAKPLSAYYTLVGNTIQIGKSPTADCDFELVYYGIVPPLTSVEGSTQNWLVRTWPDAYLFGALTEMVPYLREDDRIPVWQQKFETAINEIQAADERQAMSGGPMRTRGGPLA